jgi:RNA polymerase sigma factor (sigma-70 family)
VKSCGIGLLWLSNNIDRVQKMCNGVNYTLADDLYAYCVDVVDEIVIKFDITREIPLDRYVMNILRRRCIAYCVKERKQNSRMESLPKHLPTIQQTTYEDREFLLILLERIAPPLSSEEALVFWMYTIDNYTFNEISDKLHKSESMIRRIYWSVFWRIRRLA